MHIKPFLAFTVCVNMGQNNCNSCKKEIKKKKSSAIAFTLKLFLGRRKWKAVHHTIPAKGGGGLGKGGDGD